MSPQLQTLSDEIQEKTREQCFRAGETVAIQYSPGVDGEYIRTVTCHEWLPESEQIVISQPSPRILSTDISRSVEITTVVRLQYGYARVGTRARIAALSEKYELAGGQYVSVVYLTCEKHLYKYNLRSEFRFEPSLTYQVHCDCTLADGTVLSQDDVQLKDISCGGVGLLVPKSKFETNSTLMENLTLLQPLQLNLQFIDNEHKERSKNFGMEMNLKGKIRRTGWPQHSEQMVLGVEFQNLREPTERAIASFLNAAQRYELKERSHF